MPTQLNTHDAKSVTSATPAGYRWNEASRRTYFRPSLFKWAITVWSIVLLAILLRAGLQPGRSTVYPIFANAAREWLLGVNVYDPTVSHGGLDRFRYAPIVAVLMTPFTLLPDAVGGVLWRVVNAAVFFAGLVAFARGVFPGRANISAADMGLLSLLLLPLTIGSLNNGQPNVLIVGCLLLGVAALAGGRLNLAACYLTVPILFKVYPVAVVALLVLVQPRLGWRVLLGVTVGCLIPFLLQDAAYVAASYSSWFGQVGSDNRHLLPLEVGYRDFHALLRMLGLQLGEAQYVVLQLLAAALTAYIVLRGCRRGMPRNIMLRTAFDLGCCWMIVFGPATENNTFALLGPTLAFAAWDSFQPGQPRWQWYMTTAALVIFVTVGVAIMTPAGKTVSVALMPLGGALVFAERLLNGARPMPRWHPESQTV